jgi:hypothetical protein
MNEGFATYAQALWEENKYGFSGYHSAMIQFRSEAMGGGSVYLQNDLDTFNIFQPLPYCKGAWTLHMLRGVIGDSLFFSCLKSYARDTSFMYRHASTEDFWSLCENISGFELDTFFTQWIYDEHAPIYRYNFIQDSNTKLLTLHIFQAQDSLNSWRPVFEMPLQIKITDVLGNDTLIRIMNDQIHQEYTFQLSEMVNHTAASVRVDPNDWVLGIKVFVATMPVGISEVEPKEANFLYPNPAHDYLFLNSLSRNGEFFMIYDEVGNCFAKGKVTCPISNIEIRNLPAGVYFLKVYGNGYTSIKKFIKI